ncbi:MAG: ABC transporter ATP-binding protein [Clostridiales Family XIII bacterium]|jgi:ABC-2 type transport system ATP-binding protein|nr:ABC transporter ATP-binding protein [Clostridiales Family XIII bacterium]
MNSIQLTNISKSFGKARILEGVSLAVEAGQVYGLLGPSGCGKTTTVKIAAGILTADAGGAMALGRKMPSFAAMNRIGYMAQEDALYTDLTGRQNLEFFGAMYGLKGSTLDVRVAYGLNLVGLAADSKKLVSRYSGGMKRRLSLAAALLHEPEALILDEPTVGLDPVLRRALWREIYKLAHKGVAVLITTHVMDEAERCGKLALMREGRIIGEGSPQELMMLTGSNNVEDVFLKLAARKARES